MSPPQLSPIGLWTFQFDQAPWPEAAEAVAEIEELGYGAVWIPEAVGKHPFASAALLLGASSRLVVATGIASIHARTAIATKAGWHTLSEAFPGRFLLGLGVSHAPMVTGMHRRPYERPLTAMREYLDAVDAAPYLAASPGVPPRRVLAALGPKLLALAAERADGAHPYNVTPDHTATAREILGDALLAPDQKVLNESDPIEARRIGRAALGIYLGLPNYANNLVRMGFTDADLTDGGSDRLIDALVAWGDEEQIARRVHEHLDAGANHVAVQVLPRDGRSMPTDDWRRLAPALLSR